jgi:hypothetical protein
MVTDCYVSFGVKAFDEDLRKHKPFGDAANQSEMYPLMQYQEVGPMLLSYLSLPCCIRRMIILAIVAKIREESLVAVSERSGNTLGHRCIHDVDE